MLVNELLEYSASLFPHKEALIYKGERLTYGNIECMANQLAHSLMDMGIQRGERVTIYLHNSIETVVAVFAILKAGAIFSVINRTTKFQKLAYILNDCEAKAIITDIEAMDMLTKNKDKVPYLESIYVTKNQINKKFKANTLSLPEIFATQKTVKPKNQNIDIDLAALIYTSGSTGNPKGVMLTHLNIISAATSITEYLENMSSDIIINVLPLSFDYGLYQVFMTFKFGGTLILEDSFSYPFAVIETILKEKVTGFPIIPTIASILIRLKNLKKYRFEHLRYITNTAAHLPTSHIYKLREIFTKTRIYCMYGLTECKRVSYLPPEQLDIRPTSIGKGMPNEEVYVVNQKGVRVAPGEIGELVVRGSNVMKGYWGLPEETAMMLKPGIYPWEQVLYTGDLFKIDEDGYLYFVARKDDIIKSRGEKISPKEIENVISNIPSVAEVAVVGVKDEMLGQAIKAIIVKNHDYLLTKEEVKNYCAQNLEDIMVPQIIEFREDLPKTATGKVKKLELI